MTSIFANVKKRKEIGSLSGRCKHCCCTPLKFSNFSRDHIISRILKTCIKIPFRLQIKQSSHILAGIILKCS